jgi:hypothetical protein
MNSDHEPLELIRRYFDGTATPEEMNALQQTLRDDAGSRRLYARYANLDSALGDGRLTLGAQIKPEPLFRQRSPFRLLLPLAAAVMVTALAWWFWPRGGDLIATESGEEALNAKQVAVVTQVVDAKWDDVGFQTNDRVPMGRFSLKAGLVRLQFLSGATVVIEGPAELDLTSEHGAEVRSGLVTANVPPVAEGFTLTAAGWRAVDRGTVFGIDARSPETTEVHVIEGKVEMHHGTDAAVRGTLTTGQTARITAKLLTMQTAATAHFPREADVIDRAARADESQLDAWKLRSNALATDPGLVLYLDFEATDAERGVIRNRAPRANPRTDAIVIGGEWTQGRWPGKSAVAFQRVGDLIRTSLDAQLDAATFIVSLRIEPHSPLTQTILLTPDVGPGQFYWLLAGRGTLNSNNGSVFIKAGHQRKNLRFPSGRALRRSEFGQWHTLAVVHDPTNHRVRHYLNGALVKENPLDDAHPLKLRQLVIGNWGFTTEPRNLSGRMDELAVFNRALSDEEIARF